MSVGPGEELLRIRSGGESAGSPSSVLISDHTLSFSITVFRSCRGRNYVIRVTQIRTLAKRFLKIHFKFVYYSLFRFDWN